MLADTVQGGPRKGAVSRSIFLDLMKLQFCSSGHEQKQKAAVFR